MVRRPLAHCGGIRLHSLATKIMLNTYYWTLLPPIERHLRWRWFAVARWTVVRLDCIVDRQQCVYCTLLDNISAY